MYPLFSHAFSLYEPHIYVYIFVYMHIFCFNNLFIYVEGPSLITTYLVAHQSRDIYHQSYTPLVY